MFLLKFYGIMDFLSALILALGILNFIPLRPALGFGLYLIIKGFIYRGSLASFTDMGIGVLLIIVAIINSSPIFLLILSVIAIVYLLQKALMSWVTF